MSGNINFNGFVYDPVNGKIRGYNNHLTNAEEQGFPVGINQGVSVRIPTAISNVYNMDGNIVTLLDNSPGAAVAQTSLTAKQLFDIYSTARSAPAATYYVNMNGGSDSNNGTSLATAYATIGKAVTSANTGAVPTKIYVQGFNGVAASHYVRTGNTSLNPTTDIAFVAQNGRVNVGIFDDFSAPSKDATYTNIYSYARTNVNRVFDMVNLDRFGHYTELLYTPTAAQCNVTPNSWSNNGGNTTVYINREDGIAATNANTRVFLSGVGIIAINANVNVYMGSDDNISGFDIEGGQNGGFTAVPGSLQTGRKIIVGENGSTRYSGGIIDTGARGVAIDSFGGWAWFFNWDSSHNITDGFNCHNTYTSTYSGMFTVNCTGHNNGAGPNIGQTSCNGWTTHENCIGADFAGYYEGNHGGTCRSINSSISLLAGTYVKSDAGDRGTGGVLPPTAFQVDNTAVYYCDRTKADMPGGTIAYNTATSTAQIFQRNVWPSRAASGGVGTISGY